MNYIKDVNLKVKDHYNVIVEITKGTNKKYELVEPEFDRVECVRKVKGKYPFYYGCFPQTFAGDNDPLDMILLTNKKYKILDVVEVQPIGVIKTIDNGEQDDKVLVIPADETIEHLDKIEKKVFKFLKTYKGRKANTEIFDKVFDVEEAIKVIKEAQTSNLNKEIKQVKTNTSALSVRLG